MTVDLLKDPNYTGANSATKEAIFNKHIASSPDFTEANIATQNAIKQKYGVNIGQNSIPSVESIVKNPTEDNKESLFNKVVGGAADILGWVPSNTITPIMEGVYNYFSLGETSKNKVNNVIKNTQALDKEEKLQKSDINKDLEDNKQLYNTFRSDVINEFKSKGLSIEENKINLETTKRLNDLGYKAQPYSQENPTPIFKPTIPNISPEELSKQREASAQRYANEIEDAESKQALSGRFLPNTETGNFIAGMFPGTNPGLIRQDHEYIEKLKNEKKSIDEQYKYVQGLQANKFTTNNGGAMDGFISTKIAAKEALKNPDVAGQTIQESLNNLFKTDEIANSKTSPEASKTYMQSLIDKSVRLNNFSPEQAEVEIKAMKERKAQEDATLNNLLLLPTILEDLSGDTHRGYTSLDDSYHLAQQLKREKQPIIQSIAQDKEYKKMYDEGINSYIENKKLGKTISIDGKV